MSKIASPLLRAIKVPPPCLLPFLSLQLENASFSILWPIHSNIILYSPKYYLSNYQNSYTFMPSHWICCNKKLNYIVEIITCFLSVQQCSIASRVASFRVLLLPFKAQWRFAHAHHAHDKRPSRSRSLSSRPPSSFSHLRGRSSPSVECHPSPLYHCNCHQALATSTHQVWSESTAPKR